MALGFVSPKDHVEMVLILYSGRWTLVVLAQELVITLSQLVQLPPRGGRGWLGRWRGYRIDNTAAEREGVAHLQRDAVNERGFRRSIANKEEGNPAMKNRNIIMTAADHAELGHATPSPASRPDTCSCLMEGVQERIGARGDRRAGGDPGRRDHHEQPGRVARLGHRRAQAFHARFPSDANLKDRTVSVLAPLGMPCSAAARVMSSSGSTPGGLRRLNVVHVHYQPETALRIGRRPPAVGPWDYCLSLRREAPRRGDPLKNAAALGNRTTIANAKAEL